MLILYIFPLLFSVFLAPFLVIFVARQWQTPGAKSLITLIMASWVWALGYAAELVSPNIGAGIFWAKVEYLGITTIPIAWLVFSIRYLGSPKWLLPLRKYWILLAIIPEITLFLVWSNELHSLVWTTIQLKNVGEIRILEFGHGPWFWVYWIYSYILMLAGSLWFIIRLPGSNRLLRWQISLAMIGALVPWIGNLLYVTHLNPVKEIDWTPFGFTLAGLFFSASLFRYHMVKVVPVAHKVVFEGLGDGIFVLDMKGDILDLNQAAQKLVELPYEKLYGTPIANTLPELGNLTHEGENHSEWMGEITLGSAAEMRFYDLHRMPLTDTSGHLIGSAVVLHDITLLRQAQEQLEKSYEVLEDRVFERTEELWQANKELSQSQKQLRALSHRLEEAQEVERRQVAAELHDRVGQSLTALNLNLKSIQNKIPPELKSSLHSRLEDSLDLVEETTRQVRNVMAELNPPMLDEYGLLPAVSWYGEKFAERTGIVVDITGDQLKTRIPQREENALFRIIQESLNNVAKHANAKRVTISMAVSRDAVCLSLEDDGLGFDPEAVKAEQTHWGLLTMKERAFSIGGQLEIQSAPGKGTRVTVEVRRSQNDN